MGADVMLHCILGRCRHIGSLTSANTNIHTLQWTKQEIKIPYPEKLDEEATERYAPKNGDLQNRYELKKMIKDLNQLQQVLVSDVIMDLVCRAGTCTNE